MPIFTADLSSHLLGRRTLQTLLFFGLYMGVIWFTLPPSVEAGNRLIYLLYAAFLFLILWPKVTNQSEQENPAELSKPQQGFFLGLAVFSLLFLLATRLTPYLRYGSAPLGYDTGFYIQYFLLVTGAGHIGTALGSHIAYTPWFPLALLHVPPLLSLNIYHLFHQLALVGALYLLARSLPVRPKHLPVVTALLFLFASSITQFMAFWWMFYKQTMALPLLVAATALYLRKSWLAIPLAGVATSVHLQSAIPFAGAFFLSLVARALWCWHRQKPLDRELAITASSGLLVGVLLLLFKGTQEFAAYFDYFKNLRGFASNAQSWEVANAKGLFISFSTFRLNLLFSLPFGVIGAMSFPHWLMRERPTRIALLPSLLLIAIILGSFQFIYQNRSLIILDVIFLVFACYPLAIFLTHFTRDRVGAAAVGVLLTAAIVSTGLLVHNNPPQLFPNERAELEAVAARIGPNDYAMAPTSIYTPWVFAFTNFRNTIAPGWLFWDKWSLPMWEEFWIGKSDERRHELLSLYSPADIYMFFGSRQINHPALQKFIEEDPRMTRISPHIWKYSTTAVPAKQVP